MGEIKQRAPLSLRYRPKHFSEVVEQDAIKQILNTELKSGNLKRCMLFCGPAGCGKAQPLYSKIYTKDGYITMGEVKKGDKVLDGKGNETTVLEVYPQGKRDIYRITFNDRTYIDVADNHINSVYVYDADIHKNKYYDLTTIELIEKFKATKRKILSVEVPILDCWKDENQLIDPYLLGCLIGDGSLTDKNLAFCNSENDIINSLGNILARDYNMKFVRIYADKYDYDIAYIDNPKHNGSRGDRGIHLLVHNYDIMQTLKGQLGYYGLNCESVEKHIPKQYLYSSKETRLAVLQGLFDTDGTIDNRGSGKKGGCFYEWSTSSPQLSEDFAFLVRSLGIIDTISVKTDVFYTDKESNRIKGLPSYRHFLKVPNDLFIFRSEKHKAKWMKKQAITPIRKIMSIELLGQDECQCIYVESEHHTYLTDNLTPTHNTTNARIFAHEIEDVKANIYEINCADNTGVDDMRRLVIEPSQVKPLTGKYKIFILDEVHMTSVSGMNALLKLLEEPPSYCVYILCTTDPQKVLPTIMSRAVRYDFQLISHQGIINRLNYILENEKNNPDGIAVESWDMAALDLLSLSSQGHLRNAVVSLEKTLSFTKNITIADVEKVLGVTSYDILFNILNDILNKNQSGLIANIDNLSKSGMDLKLFVKNFLAFVLEINKYVILVSNNTNNVMNLLTLPNSFLSRLNNYNFTHREALKHLLQSLLELNSSLKWETDIKPILETNLLMEIL